MLGASNLGEKASQWVILHSSSRAQAAPEKFHSYMRMNLSEFNRLLGLVTPWYNSVNQYYFNELINHSASLLGNWEAFRSLSFQFRLGVSTCSQKDYLQVPSTEEEWIDIADKLFSRWDCPNTLGAIDGKHILIKDLLILEVYTTTTKDVQHSTSRRL
uniref:Transposase n=1 Tax=Ditylenchus dipsaci TaxID=166011 RepID=A0A915EAB6_9BILA